jgi:hypothetical protein
MDYETMVEWAARIKTRGMTSGKSEQAIRDDIYNSALCMFADDDEVTDETEALATRVVNDVLPGQVRRPVTILVSVTI